MIRAAQRSTLLWPTRVEPVDGVVPREETVQDPRGPSSRLDASEFQGVVNDERAQLLGTAQSSNQAALEHRTMMNVINNLGASRVGY